MTRELCVFRTLWNLFKNRECQRAQMWCENTIVHRLLDFVWVKLFMHTLKCLHSVWIYFEGLVLWEIKRGASWTEMLSF